MIVEWSARARSDLRQIHSYIAADSPHYARMFVARLVQQVETLADRPRIGRSVPESDRPDLREVVYRGYRIVYRLRRDRVSIVTVVHGSRVRSGETLVPDGEP